MSEKRPWATKSAATRIGLVPCPQCNPEGKKADEVKIACAWCWNPSILEHTRFIAVDKAIEWAHEHGMDEHDLPTPAEARSALTDTEPAPSFGGLVDSDPPKDPAPKK